jgi:anti-sigma28 factor (negative regulator of flagellin synthesis)
MQISAIEVAKLLTAQGPARPKSRKADLGFVEITADSLPKAAEPDSAEVSRVAKMVADAPDMRDDIVMELKERIDKGEYNISGEEIADMMIRRMKADNIR